MGQQQNEGTIVVLDDGRVVERGKHAQLISADGLYRRIYDLELKDQEEALGLVLGEPIPEVRED